MSAHPEISFTYLGHSVIICHEIIKEKDAYWFIIDGRPISYVSQLDTAKRLATKFIDVVEDSHYKSSKSVPVYKKRIHPIWKT